MALKSVVFLFALATLLQFHSTLAGADEIGTNFFLKASKSVPRIGRRSMENDFMKASKSVPRIGRRRDLSLQDNFNLEKRYFSEKDVGESGQPLWGNLDQGDKDLSSLMLGDEPRGSGERYQQYPYVNWREAKKNTERDVGY